MSRSLCPIKNKGCGVHAVARGTSVDIENAALKQLPKWKICDFSCVVDDIAAYRSVEALRGEIRRL